ncbi:SCO7613 C-terminal domain-containing membrane protein [Streptomyces maoxianensis]|uniref:SCO7613 C-terminal domain-containing membrane protein n=1 Tax=Streptomyces maoxianensis TaxID=1459942 RepID=A0ABV9GE50_9ACTN
METVPPPAEELAILDRELVQLDARRAQLLARRAWLLTSIRQSQPAARPAPVARPLGAPPPETSPPNVQNLLLTLGGILLTIAAIAFTLVSWGHLGIGGRSAVLGAVTVAALSAPVLLLRRGLASTAEAVAGLGLVLMALDAYALHRVALPDTGGLGYAAVASAALAGLWSAYGLSLDRLRTPLPVAVLTAQLPLVLWALTASAGAPPMEWALLATAAFDVVVALSAKRAGLRGIATTGAAAAGGSALLIGASQSVTAATPLAAVAPAALLLTAAGVALFAASRSPEAATAASVAAGLAAIAAVGGVARAGVPEGWSVLGYLLCAVALSGLVRMGIPRRLRPGLISASAAVHAAAALSALPLVALTLAGPLTVLDSIWSGTPTDARGALGLDLPESALSATPLVLLIVAATLTAASRWSPTAEGPPTGPPAAPAGTAPQAAAGTAAHRPAATEGPTPPAGTTAAPSPEGYAAEHSASPTGRASDATGPEGVPTPEGHPGPAAGPALSGPAAASQPAPETHPGPATPTGPASAAQPAWGPTSRGPVVPGPGLRNLAAPLALGLVWAALLVAPPALDLGYAVTAALHVFLTVAALGLTVRPAWIARHAPAGPVVGLGCALAGGVSVALLSLATRPATFAVLATLAAAFTAAAVATRAGRAVQAVLACAATGFATALLGAVAGAAELPPHQAAWVMLVIPAAVALLAARLRRHPVALPMELTAAAASLLAVGLAAGDRPTLALVLALCGVIAAGTAVRAERRPAAGYLATALFILAGWVRLYASDVASPEAYTLPVTLPALAVGVLRRRRDPEASSWTAYGPGLAATLLPSLFAAWGDGHWLRPLLLGLAALALTLTGARLRLQALLVLGGTVLALDALHELAPYVVQVVGALPRWLPPALAGLLLLAVGATYEQRLRDARRLRDSLGRMR